MARKKIILAAGYIRDILFCDEDAACEYLNKLERFQYRILDKFKHDDGQVIYRILQQYNGSPLISLYEGD